MENGHVTEIVSLMDGEWSCYGQPVEWMENGHVTEKASLIEGTWSCFEGCHFNGGRIVVLHR